MSTPTREKSSYESATVDRNYNVIGTRPIRHDGVDKVTGAAVYGGDVKLPGLIFGKVFKDILSGDILSESFSFGPLFLGFSAAFATGLFACKWMISLVKASKLKYFSFYCFIIAFSIIFWKIT